MFGIGYQEMFILLVAALVIFGPGKLPELAGQAGRLVRDFRRMTADLTGEFEKTMAEVDDVKQSVRKEVKSMRAEVEGVSKSVKEDLGEIAEAAGPPNGKPKKTPTKAVTRPAPAVAKTGAVSAKPAVGEAAAVPVATKDDPLADVSLLDDEPGFPQNGVPLAAVPETSIDETETGDAREQASAPTNGRAPARRGGVGRTANGAAEEDAGVLVRSDAADALARARRRRIDAGYNRVR